jgi:carotenoid 1,2-hydratase
MIYVGSPQQPMHRRFLTAAGGFAWWYVDLVDRRGDGLVLIWSFGLPFLPGYAAASRRGQPQRPADRPSLNLVLYRRGKPAFYLLQEYAAEDAVQEPGGPDADPEPRLRIGRSRFDSRVVAGRRQVEVEIDCGIPGTEDRVTGTVRVEGVARRAAADEPAPHEAPHVWTPLTGPASGEAVLRFGSQAPLRIAGRAYHDRNGGSVPLHDLGIDHWMWGRLPFADRELIYYLLWPEQRDQPPRCLGIEIDAEGNERLLENLRVERQTERRTLAGLPWAERLRLLDGQRCWLDVRHRAVADSGPFYLRFLSEASTPADETAVGWGELCYPERVDRALHRPFVRMKVHAAAGGGSMWVPLFSGPRQGRVRRLVRHFLGKSA